MIFSKKFVQINLAFLLIISCKTEVNCNHILGGELSYECIGEGSSSNKRIFKVHTTFYQECSLPIFDIVSLTAWQNEEYSSITSTLEEYEQVQDKGYVCTEISSTSCYNKVTYSSEIELNVVSSDFHIMLADCCRTDDIINCQASWEGTLIPLDFTSNAIEQCNNSPSFNETVPVSICANEYFEWDVSATDPDNDQLIYELCATFDNDFDGVIPPDYISIPYNLPEYSLLHPLGQNAIDLNPNSGFLSGIPTEAGIYVIVVCVTEYRNGVYMSSIRRDVILTIVECEPLIEAEIQANEIAPNNIYIINSCNNQSPTFINLSTQEENITDLIWSFDVGNEIETSTEWSPSIYFEEPGSYVGNLVLNPEGECTDTLDFIVNVVADVVPDFIAEYDSCISGPVQFFNNSFAEGSELVDFDWSFGDGSFSEEFAPEKIYETPGEFEIKLTVIDEFNCTDSITGMIEWRPAPAILIVSPETAASCAPLATTFNNLSWPIDSTYSFTWDYGDGSMMSNIMSPNHEYLEAGVYDVAISVESPIGCYVDTVFQNLITVEAPPKANFDYSPNELTQFDATIDLKDKSERAVSWRWFFDELDSTWVQDPTYVFADTGQHTVRLIVQDFYGCVDTMLQIVDVIPQVTYFLPNAFSPNGDGENDFFSAKGIVDEMLTFELNIFDRWGGLLFSTSNPNFEWNGNHQHDGKMISKGVYVYLMNYTTKRGKQFQKQGYVSIIR